MAYVVKRVIAVLLRTAATVSIQEQRLMLELLADMVEHHHALPPVLPQVHDPESR